MILQVSREEVFSKSRLADFYISNAQRPYDLNKKDDEKSVFEYIISEECIFDNTEDEDAKYSDDEEGSLLVDLNDHTEPIHDNVKLTDDFAVLKYSKRNTGDFVSNRSKALIHFFKIMQIRQLYLMDKRKCDLLRFPFENPEKLEALKSLVNAPSYREAFEIDIEDLEMMLPLFHNSGRHSLPIIYLFSANDKVPILMFLCDDGNFHTSFHTEDREKIFYAASAAGLVMGGVELC